MRYCLPFLLLIAMSACREERPTVVSDAGVQTDSAVNCAAAPTCNDGETAVSSEAECPQDTSCRAVTMCGSTIWCWSGVSTCRRDNPQGCTSDDACGDGFRCDRSAGRPSSCTCDLENGAWICTEDLGGGTCVARACPGENPQGCTSDDACEDGFRCDLSTRGRPSSCACDPESGSRICTEDLGGGTCVADACPGPNPQGCTSDDACEDGFRCDFSRPTSSACTCTPGGWTCTPDLSGGTCVAKGS